MSSKYFEMMLIIFSSIHGKHASPGSYWTPCSPKYVLSNKLLSSTGEDGSSGKEDQSQINRRIVVDLTYDPKVQFLKSHVRLVRIPAFVKELPVRSFSECHALEKVLFDVSSPLAVIGRKAFRWSSIQAVSFPVSLQSIEGQAFENCPTLTEIDYPSNSSLVSIGREAFKSTHLHSIHFPDSLKFIKERAFFATLYLRRITFGSESQLLSIVPSAFEQSGIDDLILPPLLQEIDNRGFWSCRALYSISLEQTNVTVLASSAFSEVSVRDLKLRQRLRSLIPMHSGLACC